MFGCSHVPHSAIAIYKVKENSSQVQRFKNIHTRIGGLLLVCVEMIFQPYQIVKLFHYHQVLSLTGLSVASKFKFRLYRFPLCPACAAPSSGDVALQGNGDSARVYERRARAGVLREKIDEVETWKARCSEIRPLLKLLFVHIKCVKCFKRGQ